MLCLLPHNVHLYNTRNSLDVSGWAEARPPACEGRAGHVCQGPPGSPRQVEGDEGPHTEQVLRGHGFGAASAMPRTRLLQCPGCSAWMVVLVEKSSNFGERERERCVLAVLAWVGVLQYSHVKLVHMHVHLDVQCTHWYDFMCIWMYILMYHEYIRAIVNAVPFASLSFQCEDVSNHMYDTLPL